jgi:hypothetical protein
MPDLETEIADLEFAAPFPALVTHAVTLHGVTLYGWKEQIIAGDGTLEDLQGGRWADSAASGNLAHEMNGRAAAGFPFYAWMRFRGKAADGSTRYEFARPSDAGVHTAELVGTTDNYAVPAGTTAFAPTLDGDAGLTGLADAPVGTLFVIHNADDTDTLTLYNESILSDPENRFYLSQGTDLDLSPGELATFLVTEGGLVQSAGGGGGGGWALIHSSDNTNVATIDITGLTGYDTYLVEIYDCTATTAGGAVLWLRTSTDGGATYDAGAGDYVNTSGAASALLLTGASNAPDDDSAENSLALTVNVYGPAGTTHPKLFRWLGGYYNNDIGAFVSVNLAGKRAATADVDALRLLMSTGNINAKVRVYGVAAGGGGAGTGDVAGPAAATDNALARYDGATGKLLQDSAATLSDEGTLAVTYTAATTTGFADALVLRRRSTGSPIVAGFGVSLRAYLETSTTEDVEAGELSFAWLDPTHAGRTGIFTLDAHDSAAARTVLSGGANGTAATVGFLGAARAARQTGDAGTALVTFGLMSGTPTFAAANLTGAVGVGVSELRLTLTAATPVTTSDVTAAGTIYLTPHLGNRVRVYTGSAWKTYETAEISLALTATSGLNYDVWVYDNAGTLTLETTAWTNDTTRATALARQDGVWVKSGATTRLYVGTFRASAANAAEDSDAKRFVWNMYNRRPRRLRKASASSHSYSTATQRPWNNSTANRVEFLLGLYEDFVPCAISGYSTPFADGQQANIGIGLDSTTATTEQMIAPTKAALKGARMGVYNSFAPGLGYHYLQALEIGDAAGSEFADFLLAGEAWG